MNFCGAFAAWLMSMSLAFLAMQGDPERLQSHSACQLRKPSSQDFKPGVPKNAWLQAPTETVSDP